MQKPFQDLTIAQAFNKCKKLNLPSSEDYLHLEHNMTTSSHGNGKRIYTPDTGHTEYHATWRDAIIEFQEKLEKVKKCQKS